MIDQGGFMMLSWGRRLTKVIKQIWSGYIDALRMLHEWFIDQGG